MDEAAVRKRALLLPCCRSHPSISEARTPRHARDTTKVTFTCPCIARSSPSVPCRTGKGTTMAIKLQVPLVKQHASMECWYAAACMVAYFRRPGPRLGLPKKWEANQGISVD